MTSIKNNEIKHGLIFRNAFVKSLLFFAYFLTVGNTCYLKPGGRFRSSWPSMDVVFDLLFLENVFRRIHKIGNGHIGFLGAFAKRN